ncbi:MAG TPA: YXWGXW repeat-containing protein [Methylobacter sp.]
MKRILSVAAAIALSLAAFIPAQAIARPNVDIIIGAPPPPRYERVPPARHGYVWVNGYWNWNGHRHVWIGGHWERVRSGYNYHHPEWREGPHGWYLERGRWDR